MRWRLIIMFALALALAFLVVLGLSLLSARSSLQSGVAEMRAAEADLQTAATNRSLNSVLKGVTAHVSRAHDDFHSADGHLSPFSLIFNNLGWVPIVGDSLAAAPDVATAADQTTDGALRLLKGLQPVAATYQPRVGHASVSIPTLLRKLETGRSFFRQSSTLFDTAQNSRKKISSGHHEAALTSALQSLDRQLPRLSALSRTLVVLPDLLGSGSPQTYLIAYQNSAELRATGGFIGSAGLVTVDRGRASDRFRSSDFRDNLSVPAPEPIQVYNGERGWLFRDSNWSPDFPTTAALERFFLKLDLGKSTDGVVNVTPAAAAAVLNATGAIYLPEYRRVVTGPNVATLADFYAHWKISRTPITDTSRKQFIGIVAHHVLQDLNHLTSSQWINLVENVASSIQHRDILMNFNSKQGENLLKSSSASGEINPTTSDFLYVVDTNLSYNKVNPYVRLSTTYKVHIRSDGWLQSRLTVHIRNGTPAFLFNQGFGPGGGNLGTPLDYATFLRVYVPAGAQMVDQRGWTEPWYPGAAYNKTMFCGYLIVPDNQARTVTLDYIVPPNNLSWSRGKSYRLVVPHQPGSHPDSLKVSVNHDGKTAAFLVAHPDVDWSRDLSIGPISLQPIPLPKAEPAVVLPGRFIEPHAYLARPSPTGPFAR